MNYSQSDGRSDSPTRLAPAKASELAYLDLGRRNESVSVPTLLPKQWRAVTLRCKKDVVSVDSELPRFAGNNAGGHRAAASDSCTGGRHSSGGPDETSAVRLTGREFNETDCLGVIGIAMRWSAI